MRGPRPPLGRLGCGYDNAGAQTLTHPVVPLRAGPDDDGTKRGRGRGRHSDHSRRPSLWSSRSAAILLRRAGYGLCVVLVSVLSGF